MPWREEYFVCSKVAKSDADYEYSDIKWKNRLASIDGIPHKGKDDKQYGNR